MYRDPNVNSVWQDVKFQNLVSKLNSARAASSFKTYADVYNFLGGTPEGCWPSRWLVAQGHDVGNTHWACHDLDLMAKKREADRLFRLHRGDARYKQAVSRPRGMLPSPVVDVSPFKILRGFNKRRRGWMRYEVWQKPRAQVWTARLVGLVYAPDFLEAVTYLQESKRFKKKYGNLEDFRLYETVDAPF